MRTRHALPIVCAALIACAGPSFGNNKLTPDEIKTTFFTGHTFTAATPSGVTFTMVFTGDGKVVRKPTGNGGARGEGTWKLTGDGFCTAWKNTKQSCFIVLPDGQNKWSVMRGTSVMATWSK